MNYLREWEALVFSHAEYRHATFWIWGPSVLATGVMFYCIWNSAWRDPETRLRPHKRAWQYSEEEIARGEKYRGASMIWLPNRSRVEYIRKVYREGLGVAGFDAREGQNGYEE